MIARDAELLIGNTIKSVQPIADEIVVVDSGSTDNTRQIASSMAAKVIDWTWTDDFSAARNVGLAQSTGDWVFWIDAGETLTVEDAAQLRQFVDQTADPSTIYMMLVKLPPEPGQTVGEQVGRFRLMPRRDDLSFEGRIRESVVNAATTAGMQLDAIAPRIHRSARDLDSEVKANKAERDLRIADLEIATSPMLARPHLAKGEALVYLGQATAARASFATARQLALAGSSEMLETYYGELTSFNDAIAEERDQQLELSLESLEHFPLDSQLLCAMGSYLQGQGRVDLAYRAYQTAHEHGQVRPEIWHLGDIADVALVCLSLTLQLQDRDDEARATLEESLATQSTTADRVRRHLIDICVKQNDRQAALLQVDQLIHDEGGREALRTAIRGACLAANGNWISAKAYLETAFNAGCRDAICFRGLVKSLIYLNETAEARSVLDEWRTREPHNPEIEILSQSIGGEPKSAAGQRPAGSRSAGNLRIDGASSDPIGSPAHQAQTQQTTPPQGI